jgi:hypothetical protein
MYPSALPPPPCPLLSTSGTTRRRRAWALSHGAHLTPVSPRCFRGRGAVCRSGWWTRLLRAAWQLRALLQVWVGVGGMCALRVRSRVRCARPCWRRRWTSVSTPWVFPPCPCTSPATAGGVYPVQAGQRGGASAEGNHPVIKDTATAPTALKYAVRADGQQYLACARTPLSMLRLWGPSSAC